MSTTAATTSKLTAFLPSASLPLRRLRTSSLSLCSSCSSSISSISIIHTNNTKNNYSTSTTTTSANINGPNGLPNFRDVSSAAPSLVRPNRLYRGATPATLPPSPQANEDAINFLRSTSCLVDLRSRDERRDDAREVMVQSCGIDFEQKENHIGLLNKRRVVWGLMKVLPPVQLKQLGYYVMSNPLGARQSVVNQIDQGGLILLNRILVQAGSTSIGHTLHTITDGLKKGKVYFYCSAGKDRTGLVAALILKVLGVDDKAVVFDYVRSSETWENGPFHIRSEYSSRLENVGLTPLNWIGSPPEVMTETLSYIRNQYGSIEDYLIHCGFDEHNMNDLRQQLSLSSPSLSSPSSSTSSSISSSSSSSSVS